MSKLIIVPPTISYSHDHQITSPALTQSPMCAPTYFSHAPIDTYIEWHKPRGVEVGHIRQYWKSSIGSDHFDTRDIEAWVNQHCERPALAVSEPVGAYSPPLWVIYFMDGALRRNLFHEWFVKARPRSRSFKLNLNSPQEARDAEEWMKANLTDFSIVWLTLQSILVETGDETDATKITLAWSEFLLGTS